MSTTYYSHVKNIFVFTNDDVMIKKRSARAIGSQKQVCNLLMVHQWSMNQSAMLFSRLLRK